MKPNIRLIDSAIKINIHPPTFSGFVCLVGGSGVVDSVLILVPMFMGFCVGCLFCNAVRMQSKNYFTERN